MQSSNCSLHLFATLGTQVDNDPDARDITGACFDNADQPQRHERVRVFDRPPLAVVIRLTAPDDRERAIVPGLPPGCMLVSPSKRDFTPLHRHPSPTMRRLFRSTDRVWRH